MNNLPRHNKPLVFSSLINQANGLNKLSQHAKFILNLNKCLYNILDEPLNQHCQIANFDNCILTILTDSPVWSTRLRYNTSFIINRMRTEFDLKTLKTIRIKIRPVETHAYTKHRKLTLSSTASEFINQVAYTITDEKLRSSLLKLAKHHKKSV